MWPGTKQFWIFSMCGNCIKLSSMITPPKIMMFWQDGESVRMHLRTAGLWAKCKCPHSDSVNTLICIQYNAYHVHWLSLACSNLNICTFSQLKVMGMTYWKFDPIVALCEWVRGSPMSVEFIFYVPWISVLNFNGILYLWKEFYSEPKMSIR